MRACGYTASGLAQRVGLSVDLVDALALGEAAADVVSDDNVDRLAHALVPSGYVGNAASFELALAARIFDALGRRPQAMQRRSRLADT